MNYQDSFKYEFSKLDPLTALHKPVSVLLGVSNEVEETLNHLSIYTVFDLATAPLFRMSAEVVASIDGGGQSVMSRIGRIPSSFIDSDSPATPAALVLADVVMLREIGPQLANQIKENLQVETVGDLGRWPIFRAALAVLEATMPAIEQEEANELVPRFGEYPTERHFYKAVVMDQVVVGETSELTEAGPIDISPTVSDNFGFKAPAVGAILTFGQSWFAQGLTLGNLLHSVALAPGESTRIAVYDWTRTMEAKGQENITEAEQLSNVSNHNRAISEVQEAVAHEVQSGFSKSSGSSTTSAGGGGFGLSLGPLTVGGSGSSGSTSTNAESFTSSAGTRDLAATMNQRVSDSTQQAASSVRDRRASIVKEVSEQEHESVSTRIIANYNHMHALTVQYFEVIEIYRVNVQLHQAERCLFVPMKLVTFDPATIERYQGVLANAALTRHIRDLLSMEFGTIGIQPAVIMPRRPNIFDRAATIDRVVNTARLSALTRTARATMTATTETPAAEQPTAPTQPTAESAHPSIMTAPAPLLWQSEELARAARLTMVKVTKPGSNIIYLPGDIELHGVSLTTGGITHVHIITPTGASIAMTADGPVDWKLADNIPLQEMDQIRISSSNTTYVAAKMILQLTSGSANFPITIPIEITPNAAGQQVLRILPNDTSTELRIHLEQNRLHYSQAIWRALDPSNIALLLSAYTFEGKPVADLIDPNPVMVASNYLVFRMPAFVETIGISHRQPTDETSTEASSFKNWQRWLNDHGVTLGGNAASEQLIPIPTGGVFAEAVLGRSNSAERLDATRFWNWQDSPIPLQPPEIAAIQMGSRSQPVDIKPGQLSSPILNIMNPTSLPDPTGINSIIGAMQNGNMFRDMSGLAATAGLAQSLSDNATSAGTEAGRQAAANLAVAAQKDIEEKRIAAQVAMAAMGMPAANMGTPKNISEGGALLNTATAMDKKSPIPSQSGANGGSMMGSDSIGGGMMDESGSESFDDTFMPGVPEEMLMDNGNGDSRADNVLDKMTWGNLGIPGKDILLATKTKSGGTRTSTTLIYELATYANFPRPWPDEAAEIQGIKNDKWLPATEDFDDMSSKAATGATGTNKPHSQIMSTLEDVIVTVTYFAPKAKGFGKTHPSRVKRLNLFLYAGAQTLEFSGTLKTVGTWVSIYGPTLDLNASVVDDTILNNIKSNSANKAILATLKTAWAANAEIWLYTAGGVVSDALAQLFAEVMGAKVRAFTEPFWVLPRYDASQNIILSREEFGIGADFTAASARRTKKLHTLDSLATRTFNP